MLPPGVCTHCNKPVGGGLKPCPHCGTPRVAPVAENGRCGTCAKAVSTGRKPCPHCGEPKPYDPAGAPGFRLGRCAQCFKPVSVVAAACAQCGAARQPQVAAAAVVGGAAAQPVATVPESAVSTPTRRVTAVRCRGCGNPLLPGQTSCVVCRTPRQTTAVRCATCGRALAVDEVACPVCPPVDAVPPPVEAVVHCKTCDGAVAAGQKPCPHCHALDPTVEYRTPDIVLPPKHSPALRNRLLIGVLVVIAVAVAGGGAALETKERRDRIRMAYGASATDAVVAAVEHDAEALGVSTDVLVRVRRACVARPKRQPQRDALAAARATALAAGLDGDVAMIDAARTACRR